MPKNPYNNILFEHIDGFEFFLIFWVQNLSYVLLLQKGTAAEFPALGSSHNRPCLQRSGVAWVPILITHTIGYTVYCMIQHFDTALYFFPRFILYNFFLVLLIYSGLGFGVGVLFLVFGVGAFI